MREGEVLGAIILRSICGMFMGRISPSARSVLPLSLLARGWHDYTSAEYMLARVDLLLVSGSSMDWISREGVGALIYITTVLQMVALL